MKLNIFGRIVPVIREKGLVEKTGTLGYYDPVLKVIAIDSKLTGDKYKETFIHEVGHALWDRAGLSQTLIQHSLQEVIVEQIATVLVENDLIKIKS